jgi:peptide-methionine (S)-S-oxide reductase
MKPFIQSLKIAALALVVLMGGGLRDLAQAQPLETAIVAGGCFWCVEADFDRVQGVREIEVGFAGGTVANPSYDQVTRGGTGHLEVTKITFDPAVLNYAQVLHLFFRSIDPTDAGGQFCDRGESYSTAIFAGNASQRAVAEAAKATAGATLGQNIVTPIRDAAPFYPAEAYHQGYFNSTDRIITRFGLRTKADAYKLYRNSCGRDDRVRALWGDEAPFTGG